MLDARIGAVFRTVRHRLGIRQEDLARRAGVSVWLIRKVGRGDLRGVRVDSLHRIGETLEIRVRIDVRWRGSELDRLLNARHSTLHESVARHLSSLPGWVFEPEVSFAIYRERGVIDILAWHAERRALLLVELKTEVVDVQEAVGTFDVKRRLARRIAAQRGWFPRVIGAWLVIADSTTNRRRVAAHREMLRAAFPHDGHAMRSWLRQPATDIRALSLWSDERSGNAKRPMSPRRRVRASLGERGHEAVAAPVGVRQAGGDA